MGHSWCLISWRAMHKSHFNVVKAFQFFFFFKNSSHCGGYDWPVHPTVSILLWRLTTQLKMTDIPPSFSISSILQHPSSHFQSSCFPSFPLSPLLSPIPIHMCSLASISSAVSYPHSEVSPVPSLVSLKKFYLTLMQRCTLWWNSTNPTSPHHFSHPQPLLCHFLLYLILLKIVKKMGKSVSKVVFYFTVGCCYHFCVFVIRLLLH